MQHFVDLLKMSFVHQGWTCLAKKKKSRKETEKYIKIMENNHNQDKLQIFNEWVFTCV